MVVLDSVAVAEGHQKFVGLAEGLVGLLCVEKHVVAVALYPDDAVSGVGVGQQRVGGVGIVHEIDEHVAVDRRTEQHFHLIAFAEAGVGKAFFVAVAQHFGVEFHRHVRYFAGFALDAACHDGEVVVAIAYFIFGLAFVGNPLAVDFG